MSLLHDIRHYYVTIFCYHVLLQHHYYLFLQFLLLLIITSLLRIITNPLLLIITDSLLRHDYVISMSLLQMGKLCKNDFIFTYYYGGRFNLTFQNL